ncbi:anti-sigma factor family protein [Actinomadura hibisca]|uniref:anti-sigma factor family protein n=1 Tax=Actinomadura hibisca TaxID=68565 RepID=UPI00082B2EE0|nr:zf-HC2 domain-containing protein [Actinomadura hibisca]
MSCLGERLTALVDGELGHEERDRALAHLARCDRCRAEADGLRQLKSRLRGLSGAPASDGADDLPSGDFLAKLRAMGEPGPHAADPARDPADPASLDPAAFDPASLAPILNHPTRPVGRVPSARSRDHRPRDNRPGGRPAAAAALHRSTRRRALAVGAATLALGLGTASYAVGGRPDEPAVTPAFDRFAVEHALISGDAPMPDPLTEPTTVPLTAEP